jgi:stage V sporulation protein R
MTSSSPPSPPARRPAVPSPSDYDARLAEAIERIWDEAQDLGLRPFPTHFEMVPATILYEVGSYLMPGRFSHWTHGKLYHVQKLMYDYGLSRIYELVINTNPCWAFLLESNTLLQNKLVVAHVLGHSDFFANNAYFARTAKRMLDTVTLNAERIRGYEFDHGQREVEKVLDAVLAIQFHVDPYSIDDDPAARDEPQPTRPAEPGPYDDLWRDDPALRPAVPPPRRPARSPARRPASPDRDLLRFIANHSPVLDEWQRDILGIVRAESLYFYPQLQTKIVNEGWATLCHATILRRLGLDDAEYLDFANLHAGVIHPSPRRINPYHLGFGILQDLNARHGGDETTIAPTLLDLRETAGDLSLIRNELTEDLVERLDLFLYSRIGDEVVVTEKRWEAVRDGILADLADHGTPTIVAADADHEGRRELYLLHEWSGRPLDLLYARKTLEHLHRLWGRRVWLETRSADDEPLVLSYDPRGGHLPPPD